MVGKMGSFNLLSHCFKQGATTQCQKPGFIWNKLADIRHTSRENFNPELYNFVFEDLKRKTEGTFDKERIRKVYEARGEWRSKKEICYNIEGDVNADKMKRLSKALSDYMMYLLVKQPNLMSAVAGITHIRYEDTCVELKLRMTKFSVPNMRAFWAKILEEPADITEPIDEGYIRAHSILKDSCRLVRLIREENNRWEIMFNVWMELLS